MIKVENIEVFNIAGAVRGMRNPLNSWALSDSVEQLEYDNKLSVARPIYIVGPNDRALMHKLFKAGPTHRKYLRQIMVCMDITAPLYWWKEADTYKVGTTSDSCSTMHKIQAKKFDRSDFSIEHLDKPALAIMDTVIGELNSARRLYVNYKSKDDWWQMIQLLPSSYNQRRTFTMTYENVANMIWSREHHKLDEWREFVQVLRDLPYIKEIMDEAKEEEVYS